MFYTILAGALWGTSFPIIKLGLADTDPFAFVFWRFFVSALVLVLIMLTLRKLDFKVIDKRLLLFLGIANAAGYLLQYAAMGYTTAAKAALFINLSAMWVALLSPKLLGERFSKMKIVGVVFGLFGVVFVSTNLDFSSLVGGELLADLTLVVSGVTWAVFMIYNKKWLSSSASTSATFQTMTWVVIFTFLSIAPFGFLAGPRFFALSGSAWLGVVWTAVVCWVIPYYLWLEGLKHLSASTSTVLLLSEIVMAVLLSIVILKEPVTVFSTIGAFLIVIAITLVSVQGKKGKSPTQRLLG